MSTQELPKHFDPAEAEPRWFSFWEDNGYFEAKPGSAEKHYSIVIPPPNVTGALHLGHALNNTIQDTLIRWRRMQGYDVLWMPGTDHAGIATQAVVEKRLFEEENKNRHDIGREALVKNIWDWKDEYEKRIIGQLRKIGSSCDWSRTRFTLDEVCAKAVRHTFFGLFNKGLIYRGKRLVNWDTHLQTAVADDEIFHETVQGHMWHFRYLLTDGSGELAIATTRPETMLGDTAVAVHPEDERYKEFIGKTVKLPIVDREIPVIADEILVDPKFGTGCVKVTPAHDPNDYDTGLRHNLEMINILTFDGMINENGGPFAGQSRDDARNGVVAELERLGLMDKIEDHENQVGHSDRSKTPIEPFLSDQWFVKMEDLAESAMEAVRDGRVKFTPERYAKSYLDWLGEKRDWCISRQLWWGHRIPVWHCATCTEEELNAAFRDREDIVWQEAESGGWLLCGLEDIPSDVLGPDHEFTQDADVLDTWFSSALWPHSTLGWPDETEELKTYYPTTVLVTSRDIITLWVARMVITGLENLGEVPFHDVYIHPKILDGEGQTMSKSKGNGVDPLDIIEKYGADALRFGMAWMSTENQDARLPVHPETLPDGRTINTSDRFELGRNFSNKLWNAARFALMNLECAADSADKQLEDAELKFEDRWILSRLTDVIESVTGELEKFAINFAANQLHTFIWKEFCDWYLEMVKSRFSPDTNADTRLAAQRNLAFVLDNILRLLHPIIPFVTEELWQHLNNVLPARGMPGAKQETASASIMIAPWPEANADLRDQDAEIEMERFQNIVRGVRIIRKKLKLPEREKLDAHVKVPDEATAKAVSTHILLLQKLALVGEVYVGVDIEKPEPSAAEVVEDIEVYVPLKHIDQTAEKDRLEGRLEKLEQQIQGSKRKLANEQFVTKAPAKVVEREQNHLAELQDQYERLNRNLSDLSV
jgi:valyl-tRNA synthetase